MRVWLSCAWLSHSWRKVVRLFQKWYDFSKSGTTFLHISHSRRRLSLSRHSLSLILHGGRLSRVCMRVPAPASRATNSENIFHLHRHGRECCVQRLSALLRSSFDLHLSFIYPSPNLHLSFAGEGSVKVPCPFSHTGTAREPLFTGTFTISGEGEGYFFKFATPHFG